MNEIVSQETRSKNFSQESRSKNISFELSKDVLARIVLNTLGKKERLDYSVERDFLLTLETVKQFYFLLSQKLNNDNNKEVDFFEVFIYHDDNTVQQFNTFEKLDTYHELRNISPVKIIMHWNVVVDFPSSQTIETQKIQLLFEVEEKEVQYGCIDLQIEHTNIIWASEVKSLIVSQIEKTFVPINLSIFNNIRLLEAFILPVATSFMFFFFATTINYGSIGYVTGTPDYFEEFENRNIEYYGNSELKKSIVSSDIGVNAKALSVLIIDNYDVDEIPIVIGKITSDENVRESLNTYAASQSEAKVVVEELNAAQSKRRNIFKKLELLSTILFISTFLISGFLYLYGKYYRSYHSTRSFILLTDASKKAKEAYYNKKNKATFYSISATAFAVFTGLIASGIFVMIT